MAATAYVSSDSTDLVKHLGSSTLVPSSSNNMNGSAHDTEEAEDKPLPEIDIVINNVVCSFSVRCHLNLRDIALRGMNVEYRKEHGMVTMKLRKPYTTASIWSSGKITCTGANSEDAARVAARRYARILQKLGFSIRFRNFRVVNVLGTCILPFAIKITQFSQAHRDCASYEPELHPGVTYKIKEPKATLKIFSTGSITVTARSVANVQAAIEHIFPLVHEFKKPKAKEDIKHPIPEMPPQKGQKRKRAGAAGRKIVKKTPGYESEEIDDDLEEHDSEIDSDDDVTDDE